MGGAWWRRVSRSSTRFWRVLIGTRRRRILPRQFAPDHRRSVTANRPWVRHLSCPDAGTDGLWKLADDGSADRAMEWPRGSRCRRRRHCARTVNASHFSRKEGGQTQLYVMNIDGTGARRLAEALDMRGTPAWSPDGLWLAVAANRGGQPKLVKIPLDGGRPVPLVNSYSTDPIWAPSGQFLVYSGADVGTNFPVKAMTRRVPPTCQA